MPTSFADNSFSTASAHDSSAALADANASAADALVAIDQFERSFESKQVKAVSLVKEAILPVVRRMVMLNYNKSGVKTRTGKLKSALSAVQVSFEIKAGRPKVSVSMPSGIRDYSAGDGGGGFYRAAASVNYGAVHDAPDANENDRKKIKKKAQKARAKGSTQKQFLGARVTEAKDYWTLSRTQQSEIIKVAMTTFMKAVFK